MTSPHLTDDLPLLLTGEASRDAVLSAAQHLRTCDDCRQELVAAVVAHASLTSAHRFAPELASAVESALRGESQLAAPDLSAVFAQVRDETASGPSQRVRYALVAVAAAVVIGGGTAAAVVLSSGSSSHPQTVALSPFDAGHASATARIDRAGHMTLDATALPTLDATHRYEVWLTDTSRTRMQPVGWVGADGTARLTVPANLMQSFSDIEVSVQQVDAPSYTYSGVSVLRGSY